MFDFERLPVFGVKKKKAFTVEVPPSESTWTGWDAYASRFEKTPRIIPHQVSSHCSFRSRWSRSTILTNQSTCVLAPETSGVEPGSFWLLNNLLVLPSRSLHCDIILPNAELPLTVDWWRPNTNLPVSSNAKSVPLPSSLCNNYTSFCLPSIIFFFLTLRLNTDLPSRALVKPSTGVLLHHYQALSNKSLLVHVTLHHHCGKAESRFMNPVKYRQIYPDTYSASREFTGKGKTFISRRPLLQP